MLQHYKLFIQYNILYYRNIQNLDIMSRDYYQRGIYILFPAFSEYVL